MQMFLYVCVFSDFSVKFRLSFRIEVNVIEFGFLAQAFDFNRRLVEIHSPLIFYDHGGVEKVFLY